MNRPHGGEEEEKIFRFINRKGHKLNEKPDQDQQISQRRKEKKIVSHEKSKQKENIYYNNAESNNKNSNNNNNIDTIKLKNTAKEP